MTYIDLLLELIMLIPELKENIIRFSVDFEKGPIVAIKQVFNKNLNVEGCLFHYKKV